MEFSESRWFRLLDLICKRKVWLRLISIHGVLETVIDHETGLTEDTQ